jgi:hypothetical protein
MDEILLIKISLSLSIIGILLLFFISERFQDESQNLDREITLQGYVKDIKQYEKNSVIYLITPKTEEVIVFGTGIKVNKSDMIEIRGARTEGKVFATDIYLLK